MLPESVLEKAASQMLNYEGSGMSVMEMSHRSKVYEAIITSVEEKLRKVMNIPDNYKVMFLQGGATGQFAAIPMNLMNKNKKADYILTGQFSTKAAKEAEKYGEVHIAASSKDKTFTYIPRQEELDLSPDADYVYICYNNTIYGSTWDYIPETNGRRHLLLHPLRSARHLQVRPCLRRRAEEHGPRGRDRRHRAR